jgi:predicted ester cyclase
MEETNKAIIHRMIEAIANRGFTAQADFFAPEILHYGTRVTRESLRVVLQDISATFPDVSLEPLNVLADGDWVTVRCYLKGTHRGTGRHPWVHEGLLAGVAPTGKSIKVQHIHMFRFDRGEIVEHWAMRDDFALVQQLGLMVLALEPANN